MPCLVGCMRVDAARTHTCLSLCHEAHTVVLALDPWTPVASLAHQTSHPRSTHCVQRTYTHADICMHYKWLVQTHTCMPMPGGHNSRTHT